MDDRENSMAEQTPTTDGIVPIKLQQFIKRLHNKFAQTVVVRKLNKRIKNRIRRLSQGISDPRGRIAR